MKTESDLERERDYAIVRSSIAAIESEEGQSVALDALKRMYNTIIKLTKGN